MNLEYNNFFTSLHKLVTSRFLFSYAFNIGETNSSLLSIPILNGKSIKCSFATIVKLIGKSEINLKNWSSRKSTVHNYLRGLFYFKK